MPNKKDKNKYRDGQNEQRGISMKGKLQIARNGMGFVIVPDREVDIIVRKEDLNTALGGDDVEVVVTNGHRSGKRPEGYIKEVIHRKQTEFSGRLEVQQHFAFLVLDKANMPWDIFIPLHLLHDAKDGDHAMVRVVEWNPKAKNPTGEVIGILNYESGNEIAMQGILVENGFPLTFPDEVVKEAEHYTDEITEAEVQSRKDFRKTLTFTIDPQDAKDFDDAISYKDLGDDLYEIGVHIADVSHFIKPDSPLDKEAYRRATSVYLPDRVLPMLPEKLSNGLCSLRPNEDKYTFSAVFNITRDGKVKSHWLGKTLIHSDRRYAYEDVQEVIEGGDDQHKDILLTLNHIAQTLRKQRFKKGAINFSSQEVRFRLDENGAPLGIVIKESKEAHQLIEELMLLANKTVAEDVSKITFEGKQVPFPYRVHDVPDTDKLKLFTTFASKFGHRFDLNSPAKIAASFNEMLQMVQGRPEQHVLETLGIRTMAKAVYTTENIGHYGLGFADYCHFTSPIRRYPDVLVHRILQQCLQNDIRPIKTLEQQCRHCSEQERHAMDAERASNKYKQVEFMQQYVGEEFDAIVSGTATFGLWAETVEHKCEGMVSITDLATFDDFTLIEHEFALVGRRTGIKFRIGDKIKVKVASANLLRRQIDYVLIELPPREIPVIELDNGDREADEAPNSPAPPKPPRPARSPTKKHTDTSAPGKKNAGRRRE